MLRHCHQVRCARAMTINKYLLLERKVSVTHVHIYAHMTGVIHTKVYIPKHTHTHVNNLMNNMRKENPNYIVGCFCLFCFVCLLCHSFLSNNNNNHHKWEKKKNQNCDPKNLRNFCDAHVTSPKHKNISGFFFFS